MAGTLRVVCLSAESADICARVGAWDTVVGVTAFADQHGLDPRPIIGGFSKADLGKITALRPDIVFTFSDVQAAMTADLMRAGLTVVATNPRSLAEIAESIRLLARVVDRSARGNALAAEFLKDLDTLRCDPPYRPRVYFEEWPDPPISGIGWVSELIHWCGGSDVFGERCAAAAKDRTVTFEEIVTADPELILASWCGKPVDIPAVRARPEFDRISAVQSNRIAAVESADILQPSPRLLRGARQMSRLLQMMFSGGSVQEGRTQTAPTPQSRTVA